MEVTTASSVTPVLLTWNEEENIGRTLGELRWAKRVVVLDSGSTDGTERIARSFANVDWRVRPFDQHGAQWAFAIHHTGIETPYVLALDADMVVNAEFVAEMEREVLERNIDAGELRFRMVLDKRALWGDIYPPQVRLFRRDRVTVGQRGHTQVFTSEGRLHRFRARVTHEDSKDCGVWLDAQLKYAALEATRIRENGGGFKDRLRRWGLMPLVAGAVGYAVGGGPFTRGAARRYAWERMVFEMILRLRILREDKGREERR